MKDTITEAEKHIDPTCCMTVKPETAAESLNIKGESIYFCSKSCFENYKKDKTNQLKRNIQNGHERPTRYELSEPEKQSKVDPICGMAVDSVMASAKFEHKGETFYFCCQGCLKAFQEKIGVQPQINLTRISKEL